MHAPLFITIHVRSSLNCQLLPERAAFADREKNHESLVNGGGSGGGGGRGGGDSKGGGGSGGRGDNGGSGDNGGGTGQSPNPLQAFCNSSISLIFSENKKTLKNS